MQNISNLRSFGTWRLHEHLVWWIVSLKTKLLNLRVTGRGNIAIYLGQFFENILQGGPLSVISKVITPFIYSFFCRRQTHLFCKAIYRGPMVPPFLTMGSGPPLWASSHRSPWQGSSPICQPESVVGGVWIFSLVGPRVDWKILKGCLGGSRIWIKLDFFVLLVYKFMRGGGFL